MAEPQATAPAPAKAAPPKSKIVAGMRRHRRWFSFVGALIVFGTFIVKEGKRDDLKDLTDVIAGAQETYLTRKDILGIGDRLTALTDSSTDPEDQPNTTKRQFDARIQTLKNVISSDILLEKETAELVKKIGYFVGMSEAVSKEMELSEQSSIAIRKLETSPLLHGIVAANAKVPPEIHFKLLDINRSVQIENVTANARSEDTLVRGREYLKHRKDDYDYWNWVAKVLFCVGWGLGLVGRLVGVDGVGDE
jgi:hypothetical protein